MQTRKGDVNEKILVMPAYDKEIDPRGVGYVFYTRMLKHKDNVAQINGLTGETDTFGSLLQRCVSTAAALKAKGIKPGDIVSVSCFNHMNSTVPFIAGLFIGAIMAPIEPLLPLNDTAYLLNLVKPKCIFVSSDTIALMKEAICQSSPHTEIILFEDDSDKYLPFPSILKRNSLVEDFKPYETKDALKEIAVIIFSTGTTGLQKGICLHHYGVLSGVLKFLDFGFKYDLHLSFTAIFWISSVTTLGAGLYNGSAKLFLPKFSVEKVWFVIGKYKPTYVFITPLQLLELCNAGRPDGIDTSSPHGIILGGTLMLESHMKLFRKTFPESQCVNSYGMSEVVGSTLIFKLSIPDDVKFLQLKPTSCGTGVPGISYKIVDVNTRELLGPNQPGELLIKTETAFSGYYNQDSSEVWDNEGWLKTGDILYYDNDHCFYVKDRLKEVLKYNMYDVLPAVLENILITHPNIAKAVVVATLDEVDGDLPTAVVVLKNGCNVSPKEIEKYVEARVADYQRLRGGVKIIDHLPCTGSGKIKRQEVKNMIRDGKI